MFFPFHQSIGHLHPVWCQRRRRRRRHRLRFHLGATHHPTATDGGITFDVLFTVELALRIAIEGYGFVKELRVRARES